MTLRRVAPARQGRSLWRRPRSFGRVLLLAAGLLAAVRSLAGDVAHVDLDVSLDPDRRMLSVSGSLVLPAREAREVVLHGASEVRRFRVDERPVTASRVRSGEVTLLQWRIDRPTSRPVSIDFAYALPLAAMDTGMDHRAVLGAHVPAVGEAGAFVPASTAWHPALPDRMMTHRVAIATPDGWRGVLPGRLVEEAPLGVGYRAVFESRRPLPGIDLVAAPYVVAECHVVLADGRKLPVRTYFHAELQELARGYLDAAAGYIERYDRSIGAYAHPGYSIVSSPLPTGFGMPGIAYFGRQVVRLPFIRSTSLGHEVLHDWWGNGVHPDYARGNWAEGLTTFMADYAYREAESAEAARRVREGWLRDLAAVPPALDRPLSAFVARRHGADQAIGYNKTAFVFFMLRDRIGEQAFTQGVRSFWRRHDGGVASWDDLRRAFEQAAGTDLGPFFEQWVQRAGAPRIEIESVRRIGRDRERIEIHLRQSGPVYGVRLPLRVELEGGGALDVSVDMAQASRRARVDLPARARFVVLDPDARVLRRVDAAEIAPTLRPVMLDPRTRVVLGAEARARGAAMKLAAAALEGSAQAVEPGALDRHAPVFVVALAAEIPDLLRRLGLPAVPETMQGLPNAFAYAGRDGVRPFAVVSAPDAASLLALQRSLPHLGGQSYAVFEGGRSVERGVWPAVPARVAVKD